MSATRGVPWLCVDDRAGTGQAYQEAQDNYQVIVGTPAQVIERLRYVRDVLGIGLLCLWAHDGYMIHADTVRCIELFGTEVLPALRADQTAADVPVAAVAGAPGAS